MTPIRVDELPSMAMRRKLFLLQRVLFSFAILFSIIFGGGILRAALYRVLDNREFDAGLDAAKPGGVDPAGLAPISRGPRTGPLAKLEIPKIGLSVVVRDGTDAWTLNRGVGHIAGTSYPGSDGNIGIAGHRDGFFRGLRHVGPNDELLLTSPDGFVDRYRIHEARVVQPSDVSVLGRRKEPTVTLVTCYPFSYVGSAPQRYVLTASRVDRTSLRSPEVPAS